MRTLLHRILVVDDDPVIRESLEQALEDRGYEVESAANGMEALSVVREWLPDLIILDLVMPIMDGWQFRLEQLRSHPEVPVVVLTAYWSAAEASERLKAADLLRKPVDLDDLFAAVKRILGDQSEPTSAQPGPSV
jgi:CheY-like chemotaxis protein